MKFGQELLRSLHSEWGRFYISYKALKRLIKIMAASGSPSAGNTLADFWKLFDTDLVKIEGFYTKQMVVLSSRSIHYEKQLENGVMDLDSLTELSQALDMLESDLYLLFKYVDLNRTGFTKILKKWDFVDVILCGFVYVNLGRFDKKLGKSVSEDTWKSKVAPQSFTNTTQINTALQKVKSLKLQLDQAVTAKRHARSLSMTPKERLKDALDRDDVTELSDIVSTNTHLDLFKLFDSAAQEKALRCLSWLLKQEEVDWTRPLPHSFYAQSLFHRLVSKSNDDSTVLNHCVSELGAGKAKELGLALDAVGRRPLHYAAFWGFPNMTRVLLSVSSDSLNEDGWADHDGHTPLYLAVMKGFDKVVSELVAMPGWKKWDGFGSASALIMACSFGHVSIVKLLLDKGVDVTAVNEEGENALHVASIHGHHDVVKLLLLSAPHPSYINCKDIYFGRTPLFLAAMKGHLKVVQILLEHQAVVDVTDSTGRNPHEHAVYRGHQVIAKLLKPFIEPYPSKPVASPTKLMDTNDKIISERAYGQEVQTQTLLHVYIGSTDKRYPLPPVFLNESLLPKEKTFGAYSLVVSCTGAEIMVGNTVVDHKLFRFPITDTGSSLNEPLVLQTTDHKKVVIQFDVAPIQDTFHPVHWKPLARATLMLSSPKDPLWLEQKPAGGRYFVPLICSTTMNKIGHLTSEVVVVTPYNHPNDDAGLGITRYWKSLVTKVIGHRGLGANRSLKDNPWLQVGENTIESLTLAGAHGAEYVEFDVQLTKDLVPVLYHDFQIHESSIHVPVSQVTLKQFLSIRPSDDPSQSFGKEHKKRSRSMEHIDLMGGLKLDSKGNAAIQAPFATLKGALEHVPINCGFNIEVKYPNTQEAEEEAPNVVDINVFCDRILDVVFDHAGARNIYFSSFHPEICLMMCKKQNRYPVFFLTEGGTAHLYDKRLNSLRAAVQVANRCGCLGIVTHSNPVIEAPRLIEKIRSSGLLLFTYGSENNDVAKAKIQKAYGADAIIVDKVRLVYYGIDRE